MKSNFQQIQDYGLREPLIYNAHEYHKSRNAHGIRKSPATEPKKAFVPRIITRKASKNGRV